MPETRFRAWAVVSALLAGSLVACSEPDDETPDFETSLASATLLSELSSEKAQQLCADSTRFRSAEMRRPRCHLEGVARALETLNDPGLSDAQLRDTCEASDCMELGPDPASPPSTECAPPPDCRARVADISACLTDQAAALRELESRLPACNSISRESLTGLSLQQLLGSFTNPLPSCETVSIRCSGVRPEVAVFATRYCAAVEPCCHAQGLGSSCVHSVVRSSLGKQYDPRIGQTCLVELAAQQSEAGFCSGLELDLSAPDRSPRYLRACGRQFSCAGEDCASPAPAADAVSSLTQICGPVE